MSTTPTSVDSDRTPTRTAAPATFRAMLRLDQQLAESLGPVLYDLVKLRVSQLNGCAYCVDMHATDLQRRDMPERTIFGVAAWRDSPLFDAPQRVALAFAEALTGGIDRVGDELWEEAGQLLGEQRRGDLVIAVGMITMWNMSSISTGLRPPNTDAA